VVGRKPRAVALLISPRAGKKGVGVCWQNLFFGGRLVGQNWRRWSCLSRVTFFWFPIAAKNTFREMSILSSGKVARLMGMIISVGLFDRPLVLQTKNRQRGSALFTDAIRVDGIRRVSTAGQLLALLYAAGPRVIRRAQPRISAGRAKAESMVSLNFPFRLQSLRQETPHPGSSFCGTDISAAPLSCLRGTTALFCCSGPIGKEGRTDLLSSLCFFFFFKTLRQLLSASTKRRPWADNSRL